MKAIILAAGIGSRLGEINKGNPKCLIKINGKPIARKQVESLHANNITDISMVVGYQEDKVKQACAGLNVKFYTNPRFKESGMLESLFCARQELNDEFILVYGDIYFEKEVIGKLLPCKRDICLVVDKGKDISHSKEKAFEAYHGKKTRKGPTKVYLVEGIVKKISKDLEPGECSAEYIGMVKFSKKGAKTIYDTIKHLIESKEISKYPSPSHLFKSLIEKGEKIGVAFAGEKEYSEIDYPEDLEEAREKFEKGRIKGLLFDAEEIIYFRDEETLKPILQFFKSENFGVSCQELKKAYEKDRLDLFNGKISRDEHLIKVLENLKIKKDGLFLERFFAIFRKAYPEIKINKGIKPLFEKLKQKGIKIGIQTDTVSSEQEKWKWFKKLGLDGFIDAMSCSSETGFTKDKKEAYETLLKKLNLVAKDVLFVGHQEYEMKGAKKAGIKTVSLVKGIGEDVYVGDAKKIISLVD